MHSSHVCKLLACLQQEVGGKGTVDAVSKLISINMPTYVSLMTTTAVLAPLLEETVFRGFLLASLTKQVIVTAVKPVSKTPHACNHFMPCYKV